MDKPWFPVINTVVLLAGLVSGAVTHAQTVGDAKNGATKAAMCIGCHGIVGYQSSFPEIHKVPKLSGQSDKYIVAALTAYQKGERKHPTMRGMAGSLSEQDMADLAAFYAGNNPGGKASAQLGAAPPAVDALLQKGACVSCHGANLSTPMDPSYPKIAGQYPDYLYAALKAYTVEGNALVGRSHPVMGGVAKQFKLSELKALAQYIGGQSGELATIPQAHFK